VPILLLVVTHVTVLPPTTLIITAAESMVRIQLTIEEESNIELPDFLVPVWQHAYT
jgi:hypothetical protein